MAPGQILLHGRRRSACIALALALTVRVAASAPQQRVPDQVAGAPAAPTGPTGPRTGMIIGQVVDSAGAPVPEAIVYMAMPKYAAVSGPDIPRMRVMADDEGRFFFADLPAGDYYLHASKEGYGGGLWMQRRPTGEGRNLALAEGDRYTDAKLPLWKYGVIGGIVTDEAGEPVIGVSVHALARKVEAGRTLFGFPDFAYLTPSTTTDDRGMFRLAQLMPDRYVIAVPSTQTTMPIALLSGVQDVVLRTEVAQAISETAPPGQPRTQQMGEVALLTLNRMLIPPAPSPAGTMQVYKTVFFPTATTAGAATTIEIGAGEERTDLLIALRPVPAVKITGRLVTPDGGAPPPTALRLVGDPTTQVGEDGFETVTGMSDASGRFTLLGVPAGEYTLKAASRLALFSIQGRDGFFINQHVTVAGADILDMTVAARPALHVEGHAEFRGASGPPSPLPNIIVTAGVPFETPNGEPGRFVGQPGTARDGKFKVAAAAGRYIARPYERDGWFVQSVMLDGKDITDRAFDLTADATNIVITYTDRASKVTGIVKDARGAVSPTAVVLAFPADPQRWSGYGSTPRNLKTVNVSRAGEYTLAGLPAGDYNVIAIDDADADEWTDPKRLDSLARQATKITVANTDAKTLDLTVKAIR